MAERSKRITLYDKDKMDHINPETLKLFQKYQIDMSIRDLSKNTIDQYNADLKQWFIYMYDNQFNLSVLDATDEDVEEYFYWRKQNGNNVCRQKRIMSSISAFYKFLRKKKLIKETPMEFLERPKQGQPIIKQTFLTIEQVNQLRDKLKEYGDIQLHTYIMFGLSTMARVNAMAHLKWEQVDLEERVCTDVLEKEQKIVDLYFSEEVAGLLKELKQYRKENNINDYGWVFCSPYVTPDRCIKNDTLNNWCQGLFTQIVGRRVHPHLFRESRATNLVVFQHKAPEVAQKLLGHNQVTTTLDHYIIRNDENDESDEAFTD